MTTSRGGRPTTPQSVLAFAKANKIEMVDLKFIDIPGTWQHFTIPVSELTLDLFKEGSGFDGSSIRGFQHIHESDMLLVPDPTTAYVDPFYKVPTLTMIGDVIDPGSGKAYPRDPRHIAKSAEEYLKKTGVADISYWGPELEFFIFDSVKYGYGQNSSFHEIESEEGNWNTGRGADSSNPSYRNLGNKIRNKEGYFPVPPTDSQMDLRSEIVIRMQELGIEIEKHHHEVATAGQGEIDMRFDSLVSMSDKVLMYKYALKNVVNAHGKTATFMPKPLFGDNGTGMHTHQSLWKGGKPLFAGDGYAGFSQLGLWYIGGLLKHAPSILAFAAPTTNSYRRLVPGYEAPVNLAYSARNRSACARIPMYSQSPKAKRVEFRCPDATCNPYIAFPAMLLAGLDGIKNKIDPGKPIEKDIYELPEAEARKVKQVPSSLEESLAALEKDHDYLLQGGVFTEDLIETWIDYKQKKEIDAIRLRPHPYEYHLYFDA